MRGGRCIRDTRKDRGRKCDCRLCPPGSRNCRGRIRGKGRDRIRGRGGNRGLFGGKEELYMVVEIEE